MTTYVWKIDSMYTVNSPDPDYVVNVLWTLTGDQDGTVASISGSSQFQPSGGAFIPYEDLTEQQVLGWVKDSLGPQGVANYEANVQGQINSILNPPVSPQNTPLPWANPSF